MPRLALVVVFLSLLAGLAVAEIPGAADAKGFTNHDLYRQMLAYNQKTLAEAYKQVGQRDAKWDAQALAFLDVMAVYFSRGSLHPVYLRDVPAQADPLKLAEAARAAGCNDPLVMYCQAIVLGDLGREAEMQLLLRQSTRGMVESKYPPNRVLSAAWRGGKLFSGRKDAQFKQQCAELFSRLLVEQLSHPVAKEELRPIILRMADLESFALKPDEALQICASVEASKDADPYIVDLLFGRAHVRKAWEHRGSGWANTVTEAGWKGFHEELGKARDRLTRAYKARPDLPYAPTNMITVAMGAGGELGEKSREWFNRAVKAQVDYAEAYDRYIVTILPRWGGSYEEMLAFGIECQKTERYDTMVPYYLLNVVHQVDKDLKAEGETYREPAAYNALAALFDGIQAKSTSVDKVWYRSLYAAIAWRAEQFADAIGQLDAVPRDKFRLDAFDYVGGWREVALSELHARKASGEAIRAALGEVAPERTMRQLEAVAATLPKDHAGQRFLAYRIRNSKLQDDLSGGRWASLKPEENHLFPWRAISGSWKRDADGALLADSGKTGEAAVDLAYDLGRSLEIKMKVTIPASNFASSDPRRPPPPVTFSVYPLYAWGPEQCVVRLNTLRKTIRASCFMSNTEGPMQLAESNDLLIRVSEGQMTVTFNGQPVGKPVSVVGPDKLPKSILRLALEGGGQERTVRVSDIEVRLDPPQP